MPVTRVKLSTGLPQLDHVFRGLMPGDNIVWQIASLQDYKPFVHAFVEYGLKTRQPLIYFRFADHEPLVHEHDNVQVCQLNPEKGFEEFLSTIHHTINGANRGTLYVFDCLSDLAADWCSDRMLGNFFMLTCPYLYERAAVAYFAILRNFHSFHAVRPISNTTQILVDAYRHEGKLYVQPSKVQYRHSPTMYMLHVLEDDRLTPVTQSTALTEILSDAPWSRSESASYMLGYWSKTFAKAELLQNNLDEGIDCQAEANDYFQRLLRMLISHDDLVLTLARKYFTLADLLAIRRRMIGTGLIGGKAVGMLLARAILQHQDQHWKDVLEPHDSFYIGADVFYTYLVQNGCWWMMQRYKSAHRLDEEVESAGRRILTGEFPEYIVKQFSDMLEFFGQSPIIVRSSSLLEDRFGSAFAGKYDSVFCANQGSLQKRLEDFLFAVRTVYASTMSEDALRYRAKHDLLGRDEQMAVLIQRVSGATYGHCFYPQAAGVGFSFNPYVWHNTIDPSAGVIRLVFGIGTRAVDRADNDYTRVVALNAPERRPEAGMEELRQYVQHRVDVLDLEGNQLISANFADVIKNSSGLPLDMFTSHDFESEKYLRQQKHAKSNVLLLTFDKLLKKTPFVEDMRNMLQILQEAYQHPVDIEFTLNFFDSEHYKINVVQCRPLNVKLDDVVSYTPKNVKDKDIVLRAHGPVIGKSTLRDLDWLVYIVPKIYGNLPVGERYAVARLLGNLMHYKEVAEGSVMLLGPGRWGTSTPSLGVPVAFADISSVSVLCEIVAMREDLIPDVSLGTHFFNEVVENDILYLALYPDQEGNILNTTVLEEELPNHLTELLPEQAEWRHCIRLVKASDLKPAGLQLHADAIKQKVLCYIRE